MHWILEPFLFMGGVFSFLLSVHYFLKGTADAEKRSWKVHSEAVLTVLSKSEWLSALQIQAILREQPRLRISEARISKILDELTIIGFVEQRSEYKSFGRGTAFHTYYKRMR